MVDRHSFNSMVLGTIAVESDEICDRVLPSCRTPILALLNLQMKSPKFSSRFLPIKSKMLAKSSKSADREPQTGQTKPTTATTPTPTRCHLALQLNDYFVLIAQMLCY